MCHIRTHAANAKPFLSVLALHRFVCEPLELDRKWMSKPHLTLRHDQACGILSRRNPPLSACTSAPKELASLILMVERCRLQDQRSREPVPRPRISPKAAKRIHTPSGNWLVIISSIVSGLSNIRSPGSRLRIAPPCPAKSRPARHRRSASGRDTNKHPDRASRLRG